jgi:type II secretion system protein J
VTHRRLQSRRGFTLLELLLATAVGAVVLLAIQTVFFTALRLHTTTHSKIDEDLELQRALSIIRQDLAGIRLPPNTANQNNPPTTLAGPLQTSNFSSGPGENLGDRVSPDLYTNSGKVDGWNPFSEVQMVSYYLSTANNSPTGRNLIRVAKRNLLPVQDEVGEPQVLLHGVQDAAVAFHDGTDWTDTWDSDSTSTLPYGLKFVLTMAAPAPNQPAPAPYEIVVPVVVMTTTTAQEVAAAVTP